jgi:hypothetical protein
MGNLCSCCELAYWMIQCYGLLTSDVSRKPGGRSRSAQYEPLLLDNERDAVADLLQYLESK